MSTKGSPFIDSTFGQDCASDGTKLFVFGGAKLAVPAAVFSADTQTWETSSGFTDAPSFYGGAAAWHGNKVLHFGGGVWPPAAFVNKLGEYDPATKTWSKRASAPLEARAFSSAVWTGSRLIVWGGAVSISSSGKAAITFGDGASYDPDSDTWAPISSKGAPSARGFHAAVWTGSKMLVWGGVDNTLAGVEGGGAYDPVADTWSPMSDVAAPSPRVAFGWTWGAGRLHVWGGSPKLVALSPDAGTGGLGDGASYDEAKDAWTAIALGGAPSPRTNLAMASDEKRLLVWGGTPGTSGIATPTGALYDLDKKTWTQTADCEGPFKIYNQGHCLAFLGSGFFAAGGAMPEGQWFTAP